MPEFNDYTSVFRVRLGNDGADAGNQATSGQQRNDAPQAQSPPRHRARPVISCYHCRARKQRCDRQLPCSTCVRRGHGAQCRYDSGHEAATEKRSRKASLARTAAATTHKPSSVGPKQTVPTPNVCSMESRALVRTPESDSEPTADVLEDTPAPTRDALPRQTAHKAQMRLQRLEEMVNTLLARTSEGEGTAGVPGLTDESAHVVRAAAPSGEARGADVAAAPAHKDHAPRIPGEAPPLVPLRARSRIWQPSHVPNRNPCPRGGVVTQMIGATPTPAGTNWAAVLDGIRDIQSYLAELGAGEQQEDEPGLNDCPGSSSWSDGSDIGGAGPRYDQRAALKPHGTLKIAEPEGIFAMTAVVVGTDDVAVAPGGSVTTSVPATPLSLCSTSSAPSSVPCPPPLLSPLAASAVAALPSRAECNRLLAVYFQMSFHIGSYVHLRVFQRAYARFWSTGNPAAAHPLSPLLWLSSLASMLTAAAAYVEKTQSGQVAVEPFSGLHSGPTAARGKPKETSELLTSLRQLSMRCLVAGNYLSGPPLSVEAMLLHIQVSIQEQGDVDPTMWASFGVVTRLAQRMGYQQVDAARPMGTVPHKHQTYYKEMRRRAWYTIETFDLQFSFLFGIPSIIRSDETATNPPTNLLDDDFDEDTIVPPPARPLTEHTPVLFFITVLTMIRLMRRVMEFAVWKLPSAVAVKSGTEKCSRAATAAALAAEVQAHHKALPPRLRMPAHLRDCSFDDDHTAIIRKLILELLHHKTICVLFREAMGRGGSDENPDTEHERGVREAQRRACLVSALRILDLHQDLFHEKWDTDYLAGAHTAAERVAAAVAADPARAMTPGPYPTTVAAGRLSVDNGFLCALSNNDFLMAATIVCLDLIEGGRSPPPPPAPIPAGQSTAADTQTASSMPASEAPSSPCGHRTGSSSSAAHTPDSSAFPTPSSSPPSSSSPFVDHLCFLGSAEPSLLERANDRAAKLAAVRAEYLMWDSRSHETNDGTHAARILGAIVGKLTAEDKAEQSKAAHGRTEVPPPSEAVYVPGTGMKVAATAPMASPAWANTGISASRQPETAAPYGGQSIRMGSTANTETSAMATAAAAAAAPATGPSMAMNMATETPALGGAAHNGTMPMFPPLDPMETDPFDAFFGNPGNLDWNMIDSFLTERQMDVDIGGFLWSSELSGPAI